MLRGVLEDVESTAISEGLRQIIAEEIRERGLLPFARFMEICLYQPQYGYYATGRGRWGKRGDYFTAPTIHPLFGALLGKQIAQMWRIMGEGAFAIVEMGAGEGYLGRDILDYLEHEEPRFYDHLHYYIVERNPVISERQKRLLAPHQGKVLWYDSGETAGLKVTGCFVSNELVDSFPVHRVVMQGDALQEVFVDLNDGAFTEVCGEPSTPELTAYFRRTGITLAEGQHAEVNLEALRWLHAVAQGLKQGFVITIDYGYQAQELYAPSRPAGTFMCYQGHRAFTDPYDKLGQQDMTSHVDFTALILHGEEEGLQCTGLIPQYRFLLALGILEEAARMGQGKDEGEMLHELLTVKNLILQGAMGETFKCLIQHKGIRSPRLAGLRESRGGESWLVRRSSALYR